MFVCIDCDCGLVFFVLSNLLLIWMKLYTINIFLLFIEMERLIACNNCGYQQFTDGRRVCPRCGNTSWYDVQMDQLHNINKLSR